MAEKKNSKQHIVYEDEFDREEARLKKEKQQAKKQKLLAMLPASLRKRFQIQVDDPVAPTEVSGSLTDKTGISGSKMTWKKKLSSVLYRIREDLVFAVDAPGNRILVWRAPHHGTKQTFFKAYDCPFTSLEDPSFRERFQHILLDYISEAPAQKGTAVYILLPDSALAMDLISLPRMKRSVMGDAVKAEAKLLYRNHKELQMRHTLLYADKQSVVYNVTLLRIGVQSIFYEALNEKELYPRALFGTSMAILNGALALRAKLHNKNFVFLDVKENQSHLIFCSRNRVCGYKRIDVGYSVLRTDKVMFEPELYDHSVAELAVLNAEEAARAKMLTISGDDAGSGLDGSGGEAPPESFLDSVSSAMNTSNAAEPAVSGGKAPKIFTKAAPKKHPKFMQRETPDTPEGIRYENFRILEKWTLLFIRSCEQMTPSVKPDFVMLNIPSEYVGVLEAVNAFGEENKIRFRYFDPDHEQNSVLSEHLELFGVTVTDKYNKDMVF